MNLGKASIMNHHKESLLYRDQVALESFLARDKACHQDV